MHGNAQAKAITTLLSSSGRISHLTIQLNNMNVSKDSIGYLGFSSFNDSIYNMSASGRSIGYLSLLGNNALLYQNRPTVFFNYSYSLSGGAPITGSYDRVMF